jgi:hypothetical protein
MVFLDGHESSYVDLTDPTHLEFSYVRRIGDVLDLIRPARQPLDVLHIGGGGFTLPRYVAATRPRSRQRNWSGSPASILGWPPPRGCGSGSGTRGPGWPSGRTRPSTW